MKMFGALVALSLSFMPPVAGELSTIEERAAYSEGAHDAAACSTEPRRRLAGGEARDLRQNVFDCLLMTLVCFVPDSTRIHH
jgi:hypothetical protein